MLLREEGVVLQRPKTFKTSRDSDDAADDRMTSPQPAVLVLMSGASRVNARNPTL